MRRLLQKQTQSLQTARALAQAIRSDIPQSGLDPAYNQITPQIIIQQSGLEQPPPIAPSASSSIPTPGMKDPIAEELKRIDADVKHGLLDKTGDGANANIIKLGEQLKKVAEGIKNISAGSGRLGSREIQYDDERLSAIRMQGERYIPGMRESLGLNQGGSLSNLKNLLSFSPMKDLKLEDIDERSLFGGVIKRRMAESQYAKDQLAMVKTPSGDIQEDIKNQPRYQDEQGQFSEEIFRQRKIERFRQQNRIRGDIAKTMEEIDRLKHDEGYSDEQVQKTGLYEELSDKETKLSMLDPDRFARQVEEAKKKDIEAQQAGVKIPPLAAASVKSNDVALDMSSMELTEKESEQMLVVSQQTDLLKQIEENTRPLKDLGSVIKSALGGIIAAGGNDSGDGGDGDVDIDIMGGRRGPRRTRTPRGPGRPSIGSRLRSIGGVARAAAPIAIAAAPLMAMKGVSDWAETASIQDDSGELTTTGQVLETAQTAVGGLGLKPIADMSKLEQLESDTTTGWWDILGTKKKQKKKQYEGLIERGQKFTPQEAEILKRNLGLDVSDNNIIKDNQMVADNEPKLHEIKQSENSINIETDIKFNESVFHNTDPENYKKFADFRQQRTNELSKQYIESGKYGKDGDDRRMAREHARRRADNDAVIKFKKEIESAGAGSVSRKVTTSGELSLDSEQTQVELNPTNTPVIEQTKISGQHKMVAGDPVIPGQPLSQKQVGAVDLFLQMGNPESNLDPEVRDAYKLTKQKGTFEKSLINVDAIQPPQDIGGRVYQESDELRSAERGFISQSQPATNIINAPTTNVNQTTNNVTRPPARNTDSTYREYSKSRFAW